MADIYAGLTQRDAALASRMAALDKERDKVEFLIAATEAHQSFARFYHPRLLANDPGLVELDLQKKFVTDVSVASLCDAMKGNTVVTSLNLADNYIEHDGALSIAEMLKQNTTLLQLNLERNNIDTEGAQAIIAAVDMNTTFNLISIEGNPRTEPKIAEKLYTTVKLNTQHSQLKPALLALRFPTSDLKVIDLSFDLNAINRDVSHDPAVRLDDFAATVLASALRQNRTVEILRLCHHHIADEGARQLAFMLEDNSTLDEINLFGNCVGSLGCYAFMEVITDHNNCLTKLDLRQNGVSDTLLLQLEWVVVLNRQPLNLKKFIVPLRENDPDLVELKFDEHQSMRYYDDISAQLLSEALLKNDRLTSLCLPNNQVTEVGAQYLANMLLVNSALRHLDLSANPVQDGVKWLAEALKTNSVLSSLVLSNTGVTDEPALELAEMLTINETIVELDLRDNQIVKAGAAFARAFHTNTALQDLFLEGNRIPDMLLREIQQGRMLNAEPKLVRKYVPLLHRQADIKDLDLSFDPHKHDMPLNDNSAAMLATALRENFACTSLNLADNEIGITGLRHIRDMLRINTHTLRHLNISRNRDLGPEAAEILVRVLEFHKALTSIDISYNYIGEEGARFFLDQVKNSTKLKRLNVEGCRCSKPTYFQLELLVAANSHAPGLKTKILRYLAGDYDSETTLDFSSYDNFDKWDVDDDNIYDQAADVIAKLLRDKCPFDCVRFAGNRLGDGGCRIFAELFANHGKITRLDLSNNRIRDAGAQALMELAKARYELLQIDLEGNKYISPESLQQLKYYLQFNKQPKHFKDLLVAIESDRPSLDAVDLSSTVTGQVNDHSVEYLCSALRANTHITVLNLSHNHVALRGLQSLANVLKTNRTIISFVMNNNVLEGWKPAEVMAEVLKVNDTLKSLSLRANELEDSAVQFFLDALKQNDVITRIDLRDNLISQKNLGLLEDAINLNSQSTLKKAMPTINSNTTDVLDLKGRSYDDRCIQAVAAALTENYSLTHLDLSFNCATDRGVAALAQAIEHHPRLRSINLAHNRLSSESCSFLASVLRSNSTLTSIDLAFNRVDANGVKAFQNVLRQNHTLMNLNLEGNPDVNEVLQEDIAAMCINKQPILKEVVPRIASNDPRLTVVDLSRGQTLGATEALAVQDEAALKGICTHNDISCKLIAKALPENAHLTALILNNGRITDDGIKALATALMINRALSDLELANCELTSASAEMLSDVLLVNSSLIRLDLHSNRIGDDGVARLIAALTPNHTCKFIDISRNVASPDAAAALHNALQLNHQPLALKELLPMLQGQSDPPPPFLDLSGETADLPLDDDAVLIIAQALLGDTHVTALDLSRNKFRAAGANALAELLTMNTTLQSLDLSGNEISAASTAFVDAMMLNSTLRQLALTETDLSPLLAGRIETLVILNNHPLALKRVVMQMMTRDMSLKHITLNCLSEEYLEKQGVMALGQPLKWLNDASASILADFLETDLSVTDVDLAHNRIGDAGADRLADVIRINKDAISRLNLAFNEIGDAGGCALARVLLTNTSVSELNLSYNNMTDVAGKELLALVKVNTHLKQVSVAENYITISHVAEINLITRLNNKNPRLKASLLRAIENDESLQFLDLGEFRSRGWWDKDCLKLTTTALLGNYFVRRLSLRFNDITDDDLQLIAELIASRPALQELDLSNNLIMNIESFCQSLTGNCTLKVLNLAYNRIDAPNCLELAKMLRENNTLQEIDLTGNPFGDIGVRHLIEAIKYNSALKAITLGEGQFPELLMQELNHSLSICYNADRDAELQYQLRREGI
eukprot:TRINITY_DN93226_c0_g1_i1.p1 TRINITY_DN93226_c0_g1~~TRINITY_DN93226_c0_g1_i1.p1  ORF type:complete len:1811 (-),score=349.29 TRINITY_DN93226_c0_g1_i1:23-5455(-)